MRVLFLDIDGVLNNPQTKERCGHYRGVDRVMAKRLTDWLKTTDIEIVLSSTWRKHEQMWPHLNDAGIRWIDRTPDHGNYHSRGTEIEAWLADKPIKAYAILDDIPVFLPYQMPRHVKTEEHTGLTDEHILRLTELFA